MWKAKEQGMEQNAELEFTKTCGNDISHSCRDEGEDGEAEGRGVTSVKAPVPHVE